MILLKRWDKGCHVLSGEMLDRKNNGDTLQLRKAMLKETENDSCLAWTLQCIDRVLFKDMD